MIKAHHDKQVDSPGLFDGDTHHTFDHECWMGWAHLPLWYQVSQIITVLAKILVVAAKLGINSGNVILQLGWNILGSSRSYKKLP